MSLILDAGALIAIEREDVRMLRMYQREQKAGRAALTHGGVVGQVWRGGTGRQVRLSKVLRSVTVVPLDEQLGRRAGALLARTRTTDVIDAAVVLLAADGDWILTSDPEDLRVLAQAAGLHVDVIEV